jgi:hypothetical protein
VGERVLLLDASVRTRPPAPPVSDPHAPTRPSGDGTPAHRLVLLFAIVDTSNTNVPVSTKPGQLQMTLSDLFKADLSQAVDLSVKPKGHRPVFIGRVKKMGRPS